MDRDRTELAARALRLLPTSSTALNRRVVPVRTVPFVNTHVVQGLACGAEIAVFFRHVSELLDPVWIRGRVRTFLHANVRCNPTFIEPLQHFPVAVGVIGCYPLWPPTLSFAVAIDHIACRRTLLTQAGGRRLHPDDDTAFIVYHIVIEVTQFGSAISLGQVRRIRVGGRHLVLRMDGLAIAV